MEDVEKKRFTGMRRWHKHVLFLELVMATAESRNKNVQAAQRWSWMIH